TMTHGVWPQLTPRWRRRCRHSEVDERNPWINNTRKYGNRPVMTGRTRSARCVSPSDGEELIVAGTVGSGLDRESQILVVSPDATESVIRRAFREIAKESHGGTRCQVPVKSSRALFSQHLWEQFTEDFPENADWVRVVKCERIVFVFAFRVRSFLVVVQSLDVVILLPMEAAIEAAVLIVVELKPMSVSIIVKGPPVDPDICFFSSYSTVCVYVSVEFADNGELNFLFAFSVGSLLNSRNLL
ncbi:hypothetical protein ACFR95_05340, partial [Halolamina salifodinae]